MVIKFVSISALTFGFMLLSFSILSAQLSVKNDPQSIKVFKGSQLIFAYQTAMLQPPEGVSKNYVRSGFVHPLNTIKGTPITQIHPKDHYHHFGLWNPWTHVVYQKDTIDFWNIGGGQANIRCTGIKNLKQKKGKVSFVAMLDHFTVADNNTIIKEEQAYEIVDINADQYLVNIKVQYLPEYDIEHAPYRYGGMSLRGNTIWNDFTSEILTSGHKTKKDGDGTRGTWVMINGKNDPNKGAFLMLSHPSNHGAPEPLRIWPTGMSNTNDNFVNFATTKLVGWAWKKNKKYSLKYQLLISDKNINFDEAQAYWNTFSKVSKAKF